MSDQAFSLSFIVTVAGTVCFQYGLFIDVLLVLQYSKLNIYFIDSFCRGLGALRALLGAFGPLFSSRRCLRRYTQFSVKIGPHRSK